MFFVGLAWSSALLKILVSLQLAAVGGCIEILGNAEVPCTGGTTGVGKLFTDTVTVVVACAGGATMEVGKLFTEIITVVPETCGGGTTMGVGKLFTETITVVPEACAVDDAATLLTKALCEINDIEDADALDTEETDAAEVTEGAAVVGPKAAPRAEENWDAKAGGTETPPNAIENSEAIKEASAGGIATGAAVTVG